MVDILNNSGQYGPPPAVGNGRLAMRATRKSAVPPTHFLIELYNRDHLATVYGEEFAVAALCALQRRVGGWGGLVVAADAWRFLVTLPRRTERGDDNAPAADTQPLVERWQLALNAAPFMHAARRALLVVGVDRVALGVGRNEAGEGLCPLRQIECRSGAVPELAPPQCGWAWRFDYQSDMAAALAFHRALSQRRASLVFQPIVCARRLAAKPKGASERTSLSGQLYQEALLRLSMLRDEPDLSPGGLVAALERLGLVCLLDRAVLSAVIRRLETHPGLRLGCNLSAMSLAPDQGWWSGLLDRLRTQPTVAARLTLEITETAALPDFERAVAFVRQLKSLGCQIAVDDFGSGHTRLDFVRAIEPTIIKISGEWVEAATVSRAATDQLQRLGGLAAALSSHVVAEGIGSQEHVAAAYVAGVDWMQGVVAAAPVPARPRVVLALPREAAADDASQVPTHPDALPRMRREPAGIG
ncbi:EAL domain-containing protein [Achromobacter sp.]|uniref:EAL domain-containing protein n=1 Tax=Achromobacter sp. TaxID=134375 RepID=UPI002F946928